MGYKFEVVGNMVQVSHKGKAVSVTKIEGKRHLITIPTENISFEFSLPQDCGFYLEARYGIRGHINRDYADMVNAAHSKL